MFETFNEQAKKVMVSAQEEARLLGYNFIDSEEILLGIIAQETSSASRLLRAKGITLDAVRKEVQKIFGFVMEQVWKKSLLLQELIKY